MAIEEHLPPACAFAVSVLREREVDPEAVPEEAIEAAQQHLTTCIRCLSSPPVITPQRKRKKARKPVEASTSYESAVLTRTDESHSSRSVDTPRVTVTLEENAPASRQKTEQKASPATSQPAQASKVSRAQAAPPRSEAPDKPAESMAPASNLPTLLENMSGIIDCAQCRQLLPEYVEAMTSGKNVAELYPEVQEHLLICDTGCLVLLDLFRQEAKANRKYHRRAVRDPFSIIGWEISGFFRTGQVPVSPMALAYGTLILLLFIASFSSFLAIRWDDARYALVPQKTIPTPDGIGLSDGLHIYDACNAASYTDKRQAAQALQQKNLSQAQTLLARATTAVNSDTSGCNGAEAAIYQEDLRVRQSGRPFGILVVSFDSGPGIANPDGGTDRHTLYAAYTQELVGSYIAQNQFNSTQLKTTDAPLLYLVLANTTGTEQGALQIANIIASLASAPDLKQSGLLVSGKAPLLGVVGLAPSSLLQVALPVLCQAGVPVLSPSATGQFIIDQLTNTSLYRNCASGFAFVRFSADDNAQSEDAARYAYNQLGARNAAVFYDPSNPSSENSAQTFLSNFSLGNNAHIVAQETAVSNGLLDSQGQPEASPEVLQADLNDALKAGPDLIFAPMLTNEVITLAQAIAKLPADQQPALMIGGELVHPEALQALVQWARKQELTLPHIYISLVAAVSSPVNPWQKAFYATFCQSFATPGSSCSEVTALDQGALLFADSIQMVSLALQTPGATASAQLPERGELIQRLSQENFTGVSCQVTVHLWDNVLITSNGVSPVILGLQNDGSLQVTG